MDWIIGPPTERLVAAGRAWSTIARRSASVTSLIRAVRDLQKRVDALEAADKPVVPVVPVVAAETPVRRGRPPRAVEEVAQVASITLTAPDDPLPLNEV